MNKEFLIMNGIILFYIVQRLSEIFISRENENWLKQNCHATEADPRESFQMKIFHTLWFLALITETNLRGQFQPNQIALGVYLILGLCLGVRFHTMEKLKHFWTVKIFKMKNQVLTTDGIYQYLRHPNYLIVALELIMIPLLFKAYFTLTVFSILNLFVLKRRIALEEKTLMGQTNYAEVFSKKKRVLPAVFLLLISLIMDLSPNSQSSYATEINISAKTYQEAKDSKQFVKFESESTKLGFITTSFNGYAKEMHFSYKLRDNILKNLTLTIPVKSLDTDVGARNEKMIEQIFEAEKFPAITAITNGEIALSEGDHTTQMTFTIKNKKFVKDVKYHAKIKGEKWIVEGTTSMGLSELGLPDPSIVIAKVRDLFDLKFATEL